MKIFSIFLALSLVLAASYCCCIKEALAKKSHACCGKSSSEKSQPCNSKDHVCPKFVSSFGDQTLDVKKTNVPDCELSRVIQHVSTYYISSEIIQLAHDGSPGLSQDIPLYISFHNFRI